MSGTATAAQIGWVLAEAACAAIFARLALRLYRGKQ